METIPEPKQHPQSRAVEIIADAIRILRTRDGIDVPEALIVERARNAVTALEGAFEAGPVLTDAAVAVAALLADPFDRNARAAARIWMRAWEGEHAAHPTTSTTQGAAVRS